MLILAVVIVLFGRDIMSFAMPYVNWPKEDIPIYDRAQLLARCEEWRGNPYFQAQVQRLPSQPAVIELMLNRGWIYRTDAEVYNSINHFPHLIEIQAEFPAYADRDAKISFVGDCGTKAVLFCNILNAKNLSFDFVLTMSYLRHRAHIFVTYPGRVDAEERLIVTKRLMIVSDGVAYLYKPQNETLVRPLRFDDLESVYEPEPSDFVLKLLVLIFAIISLLIIFMWRRLFKAFRHGLRAQRAPHSRLKCIMRCLCTLLRCVALFIIKLAHRGTGWLVDKLEQGGGKNAN
ncbi:MAG: hypothetical protein DRP42_03765 [Tenericutes bacterium]|nr:MAG: hypothetical protein DRP42_03765 [Mycoplasmatota bacterium]